MYDYVVTTENWAVEQAQRIATEMQRQRKLNKLSVAKLSDLTSDLGHRVSQSILTDLENHRRGSRLDVSELVVIAMALGVPPIELLYPGMPDDMVEVVPGVNQSAGESAAWFAGEEMPKEGGPPSFTIAGLSRQLIHARGRIKRAQERLEDAAVTGNWSESDQLYFDSTVEAAGLLEQLLAERKVRPKGELPAVTEARRLAPQLSPLPPLPPKK